MPEQPQFIQKQYEFARFIRDPERNPAPADVEARRLAIYRELFFNNVEDFMAGSYPVMREVLGDERWLSLMQDYFARHRAQDPLFPTMPAEMLDYLENERPRDTDDPSFLRELAHYEWMELELANSDENTDVSDMDPNGDLLQNIPVVSSLAAPLMYLYPVHKICADFQPVAPGESPTYLLVYRDRRDEIHFMEINAVTFRLLQLLNSESSLTGHDALMQISSELPGVEPQVILDGGRQALDALHERGIVLGARPA